MKETSRAAVRGIEPLEARIAPATLLDATTVTFHDLDGDDVTVKFSQPILTSLAAANAILKFDTGVVVDPATTNGVNHQLQLIDFTAAAAAQPGIGVTVTAKRSSGGGDGFGDVGRINGTGIDLGAISIAGDLGAIDAGDGITATSALKSLTVQSLGVLGTTTGSPDLLSDIDGKVDKLTVHGDVRGAKVVLTDTGGDSTKPGSFIGALTVGGSLSGATFETVNKMASVKIGGSMFDSVLKAGGGFGSLTIGGSIHSDQPAISVFASKDCGPVKIGGDLSGAGITQNVLRFNVVSSLTIGGSVSNGRVAVSDSPSISIAGDMRDFDFEVSSSVGKFTVGGSLTDSEISRSTAAFGAVEIGGSMFRSTLTTSSLNSLSVGGSIYGGGIPFSRQVGSIVIAGSLIGDATDDSGRIFSNVGIESVTIGGSIVGGDGNRSGMVAPFSLGMLKVGGDVRGGAGEESGSISPRILGAVTIGGALISGTGAKSGSIISENAIGAISLGSIRGTAADPVLIQALTSSPAADKPDIVIQSLAVRGSVEFAQILAGLDPFTGLAANADAQIGPVTVGGDWIASSISAGVAPGADSVFGTADDQLASGGDPALFSRIGSVTINGQALGTVGGSDHFGIVAEQIGAVKIGAVSETLIADATDAVPLGATFDFIAREDVVGAETVIPNLAGTPDSTTVNVVSPTLATWIDVDGDLVTMKTTKPLLDPLDFIIRTEGAGVQVEEIDWRDDNTPENQGVGLTITATAQDLNGDGVLDGDGSVAIGFIDGITGLSMGALKIAGDLGQIHAGSAANGPIAVKSLNVQSVGLFGVSTQGAGGNLLTALVGGLGSLTVRGEFVGAGFSTSAGGGIGKILIGGSLRAGDGVEDHGSIAADGTIGAVTIGGDLVGGPDDFTGRVSSPFAIGGVKVGGSIIGGGGVSSGQIFGSAIKSATIGRDVRGGGGDVSGALDGGNFLGAVKIGGSLEGGGGEESGSLLAQSFLGVIKSVTITGDVRGGAGEESAYIHADKFLGTVKVGGSLVGGAGIASAIIYSGNAVSFESTMKGVTIGGDIIGAAANSAAIGSSGGAVGSGNGLVIGKTSVRGSLFGGTGATSATIDGATLTSVSIGGNIIGGADTRSGHINATALLKSLKVGGSFVGGVGGTSGAVTAETLGTAKIGHDVRGGGGSFSGVLNANLGGAKAISIGGSVASGTHASAGQVNVNGPLGKLEIKGDVFGTAANPVEIIARGTDSQIKPLALGKLVIAGSASFLEVLGGYGATSAVALNADANIGSVTVGGTWTAGSITAGVNRGPNPGPNSGGDGFFGTADDTRSSFGNDAAFTSKIASIVIKGRALGTVGGTDHFGFVAQEIGALKIGAVTFPLTKLAGNDDLDANDPLLLLSRTGDLRVHEVAVP